MKVAIPIWHSRISPVFDVAKRLLVVDLEDGVETHRSEEVLGEVNPGKRVANLGVDVLICEAVSYPLEAMLTSSGVQVIAQTCGEVEDVLGAFLSGRLTEEAFRMPGCRGQHRRGRRPRHGSCGPGNSTREEEQA
jgi:predicted Fe-Mo cluster-binding NifX family protein